MNDKKKSPEKKKRNRAIQFYLSKDFLINWNVFDKGYKTVKTQEYAYELRITFNSYKINAEENKTNNKKKIQDSITIKFKDKLKMLDDKYAECLNYNKEIEEEKSNIEEIIRNKIWEREHFKIDVKENIMQAISNNMITDISILLFSYVFFDEISFYDNFDEDLFKKTIRDDSFKNIMLKEATENSIETAADSFLSNNKSVSKKALMRHMNYLFNYAFLNEMIEKELIINISNSGDDNDEKKELAKLRKALASKSLPLKSEIELTNWLLKEIEHGNTAYLGVLLEMFTGISCMEICALQWHDYTNVVHSDNKCFHLLICKKMKQKGTEIEFYKPNQKEKFRYVPLPTEINKLLQEQYQRLNQKLDQGLRSYIINDLRNEIVKNYEDGNTKDKLVKKLLDILGSGITIKQIKELSDDKISSIYKNEIKKQIDELPIICRSNEKYLKHDEEFMLPFTYSSMKHYRQKAINMGFSKIDNKFFRANSDEIVDLSKAPNLLHMNYKYHAIADCELTFGELNYLIGNKAPDTFSKHYCDYAYEYIQTQIMYKLDLWVNNHFRAENSEHNYISLSVSNHSRKHIVKVKSALKECAAATILISVKGNSDAQITIENDHGFNGNITAYYSNGG